MVEWSVCLRLYNQCPCRSNRVDSIHDRVHHGARQALWDLLIVSIRVVLSHWRAGIRTMGFQPPCLEGLTSLSPFRDATESGVQHCSECITHVRWVHELKPYRPPPTLAPTSAWGTPHVTAFSRPCRTWGAIRFTGKASRPAATWCPQSDSNRHLTDFKFALLDVCCN